MILLEPEQAAVPKEAADFRAPVIEDARPPVFVLAAARVGVVVEVRAVEFGEAVRVRGEMRGHPIHNHPEAFLVQAIHKVLEVFGFAESAGGREVSRHLIAPGLIERVLHDGHQFDVGEA